MTAWNMKNVKQKFIDPPDILNQSRIGTIERGLWREADVARYTGLCRSTRWKLEKHGEFPRRVRISVRAVAWWAHEIIFWAGSRPRAGDLSAANAAIPALTVYRASAVVLSPTILAIGEACYRRA